MITCNADTVLALQTLLDRYGIRLKEVDQGAPIPGSYWGVPEAGLIETTVYLRADTPLHSALHEAAHVVCMDAPRRARLNKDAGGEYCEEDAVCYLQIVLAREIGVRLSDICADMDEWGYTFRLGSARAWFTQDAQDARQWLLDNHLITAGDTPTWRCRGHAEVVG